ncbi:MAG: hypothetical protein SNH35_01330 [Rikenellaceae bacterium]
MPIAFVTRGKDWWLWLRDEHNVRIHIMAAAVALIMGITLGLSAME